MAGGNSHQRAVAKTAKKHSNTKVHAAAGPKLGGEATGADRPARPTRAEQWIARLKNTKVIAALLVLAFLLGQVVNVAHLFQDARRLIEKFSEPLKIQGLALITHEPWFYIFPPTNEGRQPKPMWLFFHLTIHNGSDKNIWISDYLVSVHIPSRDRWIQLIPPPQPNTFYFLPGGSMSKLKRQEIFYDNVVNGPVQPDGYLTGWMFFETRVTDNIDKIEVECHDKEQKLHRMQAVASNVTYGSAAGQSAITNPGLGHSLDFEDNPAPQSPEVQEYMRGMFQYMSIYPWMRPKADGAPQK